MAVITYTDVATTIGRPISDQNEQDQVTQWIADVELLLAARLGDLTSSTVASILAARDQDLLAYVERESVAARMRYAADRNSEAVDQPSEDGFFIRVLEPWWALLDPTDSGSGAFSVRPYFEADTADSSAWEIA